MTDLPTKPEVCVCNGRLGVFMGADYKLLTLEQAQAFRDQIQRGVAELERQSGYVHVIPTDRRALLFALGVAAACELAFVIAMYFVLN